MAFGLRRHERHVNPAWHADTDAPPAVPWLCTGSLYLVTRPHHEGSAVCRQSPAAAPWLSYARHNCTRCSRHARRPAVHGPWMGLRQHTAARGAPGGAYCCTLKQWLVLRGRGMGLGHSAIPWTHMCAACPHGTTAPKQSWQTTMPAYSCRDAPCRVRTTQPAAGHHALACTSHQALHPTQGRRQARESTAPCPQHPEQPHAAGKGPRVRPQGIGTVVCWCPPGNKGTAPWPGAGGPQCRARLSSSRIQLGVEVGPGALRQRKGGWSNTRAGVAAMARCQCAACQGRPES